MTDRFRIYRRQLIKGGFKRQYWNDHTQEWVDRWQDAGPAWTLRAAVPNVRGGTVVKVRTYQTVLVWAVRFDEPENCIEAAEPYFEKNEALYVAAKTIWERRKERHVFTKTVQRQIASRFLHGEYAAVLDIAEAKSAPEAPWRCWVERTTLRKRVA